MEKPTDKGILCDFDSVIYGAGFACEELTFVYDGDTLADEQGPCTTLTRARRVLEANGLPEEGLDFVVTPEPLEHALHVMNNIYHSVEEHLQGYGKMHTLLSDPVTFRHRLATIQPYKGNRENARKPYWYDAIREHMIKHRGAIWIEGLEADDLCGIFQREDTVICGIDKDLLTIPGAHYNWKKKEFALVSELEADRNFYTQMLWGDKEDHIPGLRYCAEETIEEFSLHHTARRGCGKAAAGKILETADTSEEMYRRVRQAYMACCEAQMGDLGMGFDGRHETGTLQDMLEIGSLLYMTRELREDCSPVLWVLPDEKDRETLEVRT